MVQFTLTEKQRTFREEIARLAKLIFTGAYDEYSKYPDQVSRFRATQSYYEKAVQVGLLKAVIPASAGGLCESMLDYAFIIEELYAVDSSISMHLLGSALGLLPLIIGGTSEQKEKFLKPFLSGEGNYLASLMHSEPGGTANHLEKGGKGLATTARKEGDFYIVNGEKLWTTNSGGWDGKGATISMLCARYSEDGGDEGPEVDPASNVMILIVTREVIAQNAPEAYQLLPEPDLMGLTAVAGPHTRYINFKVPADHVLFAPGTAAAVIGQAFGATAAMVGAMAVGTMRTAFDLALDFAKKDDRRGTVPVIERQSPADLLINAKIKIDTSRLIVWKALESLDNGPGDAKARYESCLQAKIYGSESAVPCVYECMQVVGMTSYATRSIFPRLLSDAAVFSLFDGGNVGIRRRQFQALMSQDDYEPWSNVW